MSDNQIIKKDEQSVITIDPMLSMIDRVCSDPNFDIGKMQALVAVRNGELERVAKIDFNKDFAEMQHNLPLIISVHTNSQTKSKYSKIEDINQAVLPVLSSYGFGMSFAVINQDANGVTIKATLNHKCGHSESNELFMPYDKAGIQGTVNKTDIHACGSTISYAKRYAMCMLLNISTGTDNDGSLAGTKAISAETAADIKNSLRDTESDVVKFLQVMKVDCVENIMVKDFEKANLLLKRKVISKQEEKPLFNETKE